MKLLQVIEQLQQIYAQEGNIECLIDYDDEMSFYGLEKLDVEQDEGRKIVNFQTGCN